MSTMEEARATPVPVSAGVTAGLVAGVAAAAAGVLAHLLVVEVADRSYEQLSLVSITLATVVAALLGGLVFAALTRVTRRPASVFAALAAFAAVADTAAAAAAGQGAGFVREAAVLHVVVATVVALVLPRVALRRRG